MRPAARAAIAGALLAVGAGGCGAGQPGPASDGPASDAPAPEVPAIIVAPSAESRAALSAAVSQLLGGAPVTLAGDALTRDSVLLIDRTPRRDPNGLPAQGRELGTPERFRLVKSRADCVLIRERTGKRVALAATACSALD